jgi:DNA-binding transcriptional ArsR family regulator
MKSIKLLFQLGQLNTSDLAHRLRTNYKTVRHHLDLLEKEALVIQRISGRTRFFRLSNTLKAQAVVKLLEEW